MSTRDLLKVQYVRATSRKVTHKVYVEREGDSICVLLHRRVQKTGKDYRTTVLTAIQKFSRRKIGKIVSLENQLRKLLKDWGKASPSLAPLLVEGSAHLKGIHSVPEGVQMELKRMQAKLNANRHLDDTEEGNEDVLNADELEVAQTVSETLLT